VAKSDALLSAAISGPIDKIRQLLASGADLEATDVNRMTPVMLAAQHGHADLVRVLIDAGANLHAVGMRQFDLLEAAADGGDAELVRDLLKRGLPVNGHWQPLNDELRKLGHDTPLIRAADSGNVEVVRVLLEAGADRTAKYRGQTALDLIEERLDDPDYDELKDEYRKIAALLGAAQARNGSGSSSVKEEVARFAANSRRPACVKFREQLVALCGKGREWKPQPDHGLPAKNVVAFTLKGCKRQKTIDDLQEEARTAGCHLILTEPWQPGEDAMLALFPTSNKFAVVAAVGTEGANSGVTNARITGWLEDLDRKSPFHLVICSHEMVGGAFIGPLKGSLKGSLKVAESIAEICPDCLGDDFVDARELAKALKSNKSFLLRWD
jgi:hypothetical protein